MHELLPCHNHVYYLSQPKNDFERAYIQIREKENRVLSDLEVQSLPYLHQQHPKNQEWKKRIGSTKRILDYTATQKPMQILDLGCGNGWFTRLLQQKSNNTVTGVDVNVLELEQAARLFSSSQCHFVYGDVFADQWPITYFDMITLNACVQYFPNLNQLINRLLQLLKTKGTIHFIDSPFYQKTAIESAKQRTKTYYQKNGIEAMTAFYHHHSWEALQKFKPQIAFQPASFFNKIRQKIDSNTAPFPWVIITKK